MGRNTKIPNSFLSTRHLSEGSINILFWELWAELISKYQLAKLTSLTDYKKLLTKICAGSIESPLDLSRLTKKQAQALDLAIGGTGMTITLWQTTKCPLDYPANGATREFRKNQLLLPILLGKIKGKTAEQTDTFAQFRQEVKKLHQPDDFEKLTPVAKTKSLALARADQSQILDMLALGDDLNILRAVKRSPPSVRSGINSYTRFCAVINIPALPPTAETAQLWSATFNPGKTFAQYLAHLQKETLLPNHPLDWMTPTIRNIAKGLRNAQDLSFKFPNIIKAADLLRALEWTELDNPQGQSYFISYLCALRVPSATLMLTRAFSDDRITEFVPKADKALIATRAYRGGPVLVIILAYRKNIRNGCILMRPCLCAEASQEAIDLCPAHQVWPRICDRAMEGGPLFPGMNANNFNRMLKATMTTLHFDQGGCYSSHAFRRGANGELKNGDSTLATSLKAGTWVSATYRRYIDLKADGSLNISALLLAGLSSRTRARRRKKERRQTGNR